MDKGGIGMNECPPWLILLVNAGGLLVGYLLGKLKGTWECAEEFEKLNEELENWRRGIPIFPKGGIEE